MNAFVADNVPPRTGIHPFALAFLRILAPSAPLPRVSLVLSFTRHRNRAQIPRDPRFAIQVVQSLDNVAKSLLKSVLVHIRSSAQDADVQSQRSNLWAVGAAIARADKLAEIRR